MARNVGRFFVGHKQFSLLALVFITGTIFDLGGLELVTKWLFGVAAGIAVLPLLYRMYADLRAGKYGIDILTIWHLLLAFWTEGTSQRRRA